MKLLDSHFEILQQGPKFNDGLKFVEDIGRTCYLSEDKKTEDSFSGFCERLIKSKHLAMMEFFTLYLKITAEDPRFKEVINFYNGNQFSHIFTFQDPSTGILTSWITTNYRVILENNRDKDTVFMVEEPELYHEKRRTVRFYCNRSVSHELVRSRLASFSQQSQRYVCYSKSRFGGELTFIIPDKMYRIRDERSECYDSLTHESYGYLKELEGERLVSELTTLDRGVSAWWDAMKRAEEDYRYLTLEEEWSAQDARDVLPNAVQTVINVCMYDCDWVHFFNLRSLGTTGKPDPNMKRLVDPVLQEFIDRGWIKRDGDQNLIW